MADFPFLSVLTIAPLVGALVVWLLPRSRPTLAKQVALGWSLLVLALSIVMWVAFEASGDRFQFRESYAWIPAWGINFTLAADGIALVMLMLIAVLVPLVILASWHDVDVTSGAQGAEGAPRARVLAGAKRSVPVDMSIWVSASQSSVRLPTTQRPITAASMNRPPTSE